MFLNRYSKRPNPSRDNTAPLCLLGSQLDGIATMGGCGHTLAAEDLEGWLVYSCDCGKFVDRHSADEAAWGALANAAAWQMFDDPADPNRRAAYRRQELWEWTAWVAVDPAATLSCTAAVRLGTWIPHPERHRLGVHLFVAELDTGHNCAWAAARQPSAFVGSDNPARPPVLGPGRPDPRG